MRRRITEPAQAVNRLYSADCISAAKRSETCGHVRHGFAGGSHNTLPSIIPRLGSGALDTTTDIGRTDGGLIQRANQATAEWKQTPVAALGERQKQGLRTGFQSQSQTGFRSPPRNRGWLRATLALWQGYRVVISSQRKTPRSGLAWWEGLSDGKPQVPRHLRPSSARNRETRTSEQLDQLVWRTVGR